MASSLIPITSLPTEARERLNSLAASEGLDPTDYVIHLTDAGWMVTVGLDNEEHVLNTLQINSYECIIPTRRIPTPRRGGGQ